jgi:hypothetical protein
MCGIEETMTDKNKFKEKLSINLITIMMEMV